MTNDTIGNTDTTTYCARHPAVETGLRCASCSTPICPKCMVVTPVGMKCPDCGRIKDSPLFKVRPERLMLAGVVALVAGMIASLIGELGFFVILASIPYGYFAGNMVLRASGMKRGTKLEVLTAAAMVLGAILAQVAVPLFSTWGIQHGVALQAAFAQLINVWFWAATIISTVCAVSKIRYL